MPAGSVPLRDQVYLCQRGLAQRLVITLDELARMVRARELPPPNENSRWNFQQLAAGYPIVRLGRVYFIEAGDFIKIGFATAVNQRLRNLRASNPIECRLIYSVAGTLATERQIHHRFAHLRHHGEWFRKEPELLAFIKTVKHRASAVPR